MKALVYPKPHYWKYQDVPTPQPGPEDVLEPLSCAVHGIKLLDITPGAEVLIFGAGPAGLMLLQLAKYGGSSKMVIVDPNSSKLNKAKELGAGSAVLIGRTDHIKKGKTLLNIAPLGYDYVIDATGRPEVQENCLKLVKKGGKSP